MLFFLVVASASNEGDSAATKLTAILKEFGSSRGNFTQTRISKEKTIIERSAGYFRVQSPSRLVWVYTNPFSHSIVIDGTTLWLYDPDLEQVTRKDLDLQSPQIPSVLLTDYFDIPEQYDISTDKDRSLADASWTWFDLTPKRIANFVSVSIGVHEQQVTKVELKDTLGQLTVLEFNSLQTELEFDDAEFQFIPPEGVEIIDALEGFNF